MSNPTVLTTFADPDPLTTIASAQELIDLLKSLVATTIQGTYVPYVIGSTTPSVGDQDKAWIRVDGSGRPLGTYVYYGASWRKSPTGLTKEIRQFTGNPATYFDTSGLGLQSPDDWDGWAICLSGDSAVELEDGSTKTIREIVENKLSVRVRCYDESTMKFVSSDVTDWFRNEFNKEDFVRVRFNKGLQTSGKRSITATKDHPFLTEFGWKKAGQLNTGDKVYGYEKTLNFFGKEALLGMWLGDGSYSFGDGRFSVTHGSTQKTYTEYIASEWGVRVEEQTGVEGSYNAGKKAYRARLGIRNLFPEFERMVPKRTPHVTSALLSELTEVSLAFWFMDDGSLQQDSRYPDYQRACFHTQGFDDSERTLLADFLEQRWGLTGTYYHAAKNERPEQKFLRLDKLSSATFFGLIAPYVHPAMRYKIPSEHWNVPCVLKERRMTEMGMVLREIQVREFSSLHWSETFKTDQSARYDIKINGYHNFVANGFVVHNCNGGNGTTNLSNLFLVGADMNNGSTPPLVSGYAAGWNTKVTGNTLATGGSSQYTLINDNLPFTQTQLTGFSASGASHSEKKAIVTGGYDSSTNSGDGNTIVISSFGADPSTVPPTVQVAVPTTPPFYALAYCQWVGYA